MKYRIESNIPIPPKAGPARDPNSFAGKLRALKRGQSIYKKGMNITTASVYANREMGAGNYTARTMNGGVRIWRIK